MIQISDAKWVLVDSVQIPQGAAPPRQDLVDRMVRSMQDFGQIASILIRSDGELVSGRHRFEAARALGKQVLVRVVDGPPEAVDALRADENKTRQHGLGPLEDCLNAYAYEVWLIARGERASVGRSGVTTAQLAARTGESRRTLQRQLAVARGLTPAARDALVVQPDAATWTMVDLERLVTLPPDRQMTLAEQVGVTPLAALLDAVVPRTKPPAPSPEAEQVARLEAFVETGVALGGAWAALADEVEPVLAAARALAGEVPGAAPPATEADSAEGGAPPVTTGHGEPTAEGGPTDRERAFLAAFVDALERVGAVRTGGRLPPVTKARMMGPLTPALGAALGVEVRVDGEGFRVRGRVDAVSALEALLAVAPDPPPPRLRDALRRAESGFAARSPEAAAAIADR
ncbi:MAG: ParB-like chromosome segregation protein Spo0J [Myxococcota bacterium]|jgi:ParB-like chromosome segregation protein Spo0J